MNRIVPPRWMESLLRHLLPLHDRETIAGDLREEFQDRAVAQSRASGRLWYLRQVMSFAPHRLHSALAEGPLLPLLCAFTGLCGLWLGAMDIRLRHFGAGTAIAAAIVCQAMVTLGALRFRRHLWLRFLSLLGCLGMLGIAGKALVGLIRGYEFEGYILLIALLLVVQSVLTFATLPWIHSEGRGKSA